MKKFWFLATLLIGCLLLAWCNTNNSQPNLKTESGRLLACNDRVGFYLNTNTFTASWDKEEKGGASFILSGHVEYTKQWENAEDDVQCVVDMVDWSVNVEFSNHIYNGETQDENVCTWDESCDIPSTLDEENVYTIVNPDDWYAEEIESWKLVLRKGVEDHTDIIFIEQSMWQDYLDPHKLVYWDDVVFKWELTSIDWAAWTHYYNADTIEELEELFNLKAE